MERVIAPVIIRFSPKLIHPRKVVEGEELDMGRPQLLYVGKALPIGCKSGSIWVCSLPPLKIDAYLVRIGMKFKISLGTIGPDTVISSFHCIFRDTLPWLF
ncbi:Uncharacterised protein [Mycobacteroides abscessus subsp. abscessus]|nr:Uncharacterised protein [Mycobacteroides abscessus subsp. abscessus]